MPDDVASDLSGSFTIDCIFYHNVIRFVRKQGRLDFLRPPTVNLLLVIIIL
jgi:hypothetical protein